MMGEEMARIWGTWVQEPGIDGWVWDGDYRDEDMQAVAAPPKWCNWPMPPNQIWLSAFSESCGGPSRAGSTPTLQADPKQVRQLCG